MKLSISARYSRFLGISAVFSASVLALGLLPNPAQAEEASGRLQEFIGDSAYSTELFQLHQSAGHQGAPKDQPWSGSYWPLHTGSIADPYNENQNGFLNHTFRKIKPTQNLYKRFEKRLIEYRRAIQENKLTPEMIDEMAPSEKYDLYLGDADFSLSSSIWAATMDQLNRIGKIALWEGSCHGWAAASIYVPRPQKKVHVLSLDGKYLIPLYPDDLKGLATLLWANSLVQDSSVVMGSRCTDRRPKFDSRSGKVLNDSCEGVNPGDFHVALLELVGKRKQSFIINRTNNTQVWNQPVNSYELRPFNLLTGKPGSLQESVTERYLLQDRHRNYRSGRATALVGIQLTLKYGNESRPKHKDQDSKDDDKMKSLRLTYDLELDPQMNIVGGEWINSEVLNASAAAEEEYENGITPPKYPGFVWKFTANPPTAYSVADADLGMAPLAEISRDTLIKASKKAANFKYRFTQPKERLETRPQPLGRVVYELISQSTAR